MDIFQKVRLAARFLIMNCTTMPSTMPKIQATLSVINRKWSYSLIISKNFTKKMLILNF